MARVDDLHRTLGLTDGELARVTDQLERDPNDFELAVYSLLWSEHCAYKHSRLLLKRLPTEGAQVLQGPGENAGVVDIGDGWCVAMKVESHNHPSAVEPFQGAATGVGGILRDIVAMGAEPIAILDSLRFGPVDAPRVPYLFDGVVAGIGHYGNSFGVPTVGGEVAFEGPYAGNPLVNAMCVGVARREHLQRARAVGEGNVLVLIGARTGRDGIGGASVLASQTFESGDEDKRPSVQVGDPFTGNVLARCLLECNREGLFVGLQDCGAAGLASSIAEMATKGDHGVELDLSAVPVREEGMAAFEVMISESQERFVACVEAGDVEEVRRRCRRWDLDATPIATVTASHDRLVCRFEGEVVGDLPVDSLTEGAPRYRLSPRRPADEAVSPLDPADVPAPDRPGDELLLELLGSPNLASRRPVFERYDHIIGRGTIVRPGHDAAVVRLPDGRGLAVTIDGDGRLCELDPRGGAMAAVCEAARNLACAGALPLAATDGLNFGDPEDPTVAWQLTECIEGLAEACTALEVPIVSGNVSLYNASDGRHVHPTPLVGMVGLVDDPSRAGGAAFGAPGDAVLIVGVGRPALDGSEYLAVVHGQVAGRPPRPDLLAEGALGAFLVAARRGGLITSAHDVARGGLAVTIAECCLLGEVGAEVTIDGTDGLREDVALFGEAPGLVVVSCPADAVEALSALAPPGVAGTLRRIGTVGGDDLVVRVGDQPPWRVPLSVMARSHEQWMATAEAG